jgi:hypothetical protein
VVGGGGSKDIIPLGIVIKKFNKAIKASNLRCFEALLNIFLVIIQDLAELFQAVVELPAPMSPKQQELGVRQALGTELKKRL